MPLTIYAVDIKEAGQHWFQRLINLIPIEVRNAQLFGLFIWQWLSLVLLCVGSFLLGTILQWIFSFGLRRVVARTALDDTDEILKTSPGPLRWALTVVFIFLFLPTLELPAGANGVLELVMRTALIVIGAWVLIRLATMAATILEAYLVRQTSNPSLQRSIRTQIVVPLRVFRFLIVVLGIALVLIQFDLVRNVGLSMLASAGVAGVVVGLAAQRTVANLLAGIQLAIFQPIRIGDAVVVESEYGTVEEIGLTYVIIKIWDERRLILPVSYFLERPFHNWTRQTPEMLGTVLLHVDYTIPIEELRQELKQILQETPLWDRRVQAVQVTGFNEYSVDVRLLLSAKDGPCLWDLRCLVREKMLMWLQTNGRAYLPIRRSETRTIPGGTSMGQQFQS